MQQVEIDDTLAGGRLDRILADEVNALSRSRIKALMLDGQVRLNGETIKDPSYRVKLGQIIEITIPPPVAATPVPQSIPLDIVFEDDDIIVVNKAAGLVVHPGAGTPDGTLVNALLAHCGDSLSGIGGVARPGIVHRIDKDTSGVLVVAKNDAAHQSLSAQFEAHTVERTYQALVWGDVRKLAGSIEGNIARSTNNRKKMTLVKSGGREAITHYKVKKRFGPPGDALVTLITCNLETGRTHQIRVHMTQFGHALVGDTLYGRPRKLGKLGISDPIRVALTSFGRQALHAASLGFTHPTSQEHISFQAELPSDFSKLLDALASM